MKQLPANGSPQESQTSDAAMAQSTSHATSQQSDSPLIAQTSLQHPGESHPGEACGIRQLPGTGSVVSGSRQSGLKAQRSNATLTQASSHSTRQQ